MAPRKAPTDGSSEPRRSSRIADKPKPSVKGKPAPKKSSKKREAEGEGETLENGKRQTKKAKGDENGEEHDELADDRDDEDTVEVKPISNGDLLPAVTVTNERDEDVNVGELAAEKGLVLFLVPKADTPGCTKQACGFRDSYPDFSKYNFNVYCVSADTVSAQAKWQTKQRLPYSLLSDPKRALIKALGAADGNKTKRSHFIFEKGGKLVDKKIPVKPVESPQQALDFIKSIQT